jgi:DNA-binding IclR family transcriptional regulator
MANSSSGESVLERTVRILDTFTTERTVQSVAQIGRRARLASSTAHRLVDDLVASGLLERDDERRVRLGMRLWELALRGSRALRLRQAALPAMERVQAEIRQHTQLAVFEQGEALFLERLSSPDAGANIARIAERLPLHASSAGIVLLAHSAPELQEQVLAGPLPALASETITQPEALRRKLAEVRSLGHAVMPGTVEAVSTGIAVPVRDARGEVVAALSVVLPRELAPAPAIAALRAGAERIRVALAAEPTDPA